MSSELVLRHLDLDHPADVVWRLLTDDGGLATWMGEGSTIDARPGGALWVADVETGRPRWGRVLDVDPGRELAVRWWPEGADEHGEGSEVRFTLLPRPGGTRLVVQEQPVPASATASAAGDARARAGGGRACTVDLVGEAWTWRLGALLTATARSLAVAR
jgi:uncharacterized protein YndB with AHSA1/START domain